MATVVRFRVEITVTTTTSPAAIGISAEIATAHEAVDAGITLRFTAIGPLTDLEITMEQKSPVIQGSGVATTPEVPGTVTEALIWYMPETLGEKKPVLGSYSPCPSEISVYLRTVPAVEVFTVTAPSRVAQT